MLECPSPALLWAHPKRTLSALPGGGGGGALSRESPLETLSDLSSQSLVRSHDLSPDRLHPAWTAAPPAHGGEWGAAGPAVWGAGHGEPRPWGLSSHGRLPRRPPPSLPCAALCIPGRLESAQPRSLLGASPVLDGGLEAGEAEKHRAEARAGEVGAIGGVFTAG